MGCTPEAVVCDDSPSTSDLSALLVEVVLGSLLLALLVLGVVVLLRRRPPRRAPVSRVWVSADGDVVHRRP